MPHSQFRPAPGQCALAEPLAVRVDANGLVTGVEISTGQPSSSLCASSTIADARGGCPPVSSSGQCHRFTDAMLGQVDGVEPYRGYQLLTFWDEDGDGFLYAGYIARGPHRDHLLNLSRFNFHPTQARFEWLVDFGFPPFAIFTTGIRAPLDDAVIDNAIAAQLRSAA